MMRQILRTLGPLVAVGMIGACEPATITEARQQIGRGGLRIVEYLLPVIDTTFQVQNVLDSGSVDTTATGLLGVAIDPESVTVSLGDRLDFENITFDRFIFTFLPGTFSVGPGTPIPFVGTYAGLASDTILDVDSVVVRTGTLNVVTSNRLPLDVTYSTTLTGIVGPGGAPLIASGTIPAAPGDGSYVSDVVPVDLAGAKVIPALVDLQVSGSTIMGSSPVDPALGDSAVIQTGDVGSLTVDTVWGSLDPTTTPELVLAVEEVEEIPRVNLGLDQELEDALAEASINDATITLVLNNSTDAPATLRGFALGLVKLDPSGTVPRDGLGNPILEVDGTGSPIVVSVTDPGQTTLSVPRLGTTTIALASAAVVDRLVDLLLNDDRVSVVATGDVEIGDGTPSSVTRSDSVGVTLATIVGLDVTIPDTGIVVTPDNTTEDGLGLDPEDADQLVDRLESATLTADLANGLPFGVAVDIAFVAGAFPAGTDVFTQPGAVVLSTISVPGPQVDAQGLVVQPATSTVTISLSGAQARQLLENQFTAGMRTRIMPGAGGSQRGAIRATDQIIIDTEVQIRVRSGATP